MVGVHRLIYTSECVKMSAHIFPKIELARAEKGLCIKCGENNPMNDKRLGLKDPLCPKCREKYDEESKDWKSIISDVLY